MNRTKGKVDDRVWMTAVGVTVAVVFSAVLVMGGETPSASAPADLFSPTLGVKTNRQSKSLVVTSTDKSSRRFGFQVGDVINEVEGNKIGSVQDFVAAVEEKKPGDQVTVYLDRGYSSVRIRRHFHGNIRGENGERQSTAESPKSVVRSKDRPRKLSAADSVIRSRHQGTPSSSLRDRTIAKRKAAGN